MILRRLFTGSSALVPVLFALIAPGCSTEAYCFVCESQSQIEEDGGAGTAGTGGTDINIGGSGGSGGTINIGGSAGSLPDGGATCTADTENDPTNCGTCGNVCSLLGAYAACVGGECVIDDCAEGYKDLNMTDSDGCEYVCPVLPETEEVCNGEDDNCDGVKDEGFDLTTIDNCGSCGNNCALTNATVDCQQISGQYQCVVTGCTPGYENVDQVNANGCEYPCPVYPPIPEECNEVDDDCNGVVNEGNPGGGELCGDPCPNGICQGLCEAGETLCVGNGLVCVGGRGAEAEVCDGEDNDCNGVDDNGFNTNTDVLNCGMCGRVCNLPHAVSGCSNGNCVVASCQPGYRDLNNNDMDGCEQVCAQYPTSTEVCDGVDNDCDNQVDEGVTAPPGFCRQTGPCNGATASCTMGQWRCNYLSRNPNIEVNPATGALVLEETKCDNFDGDCDGQTDESFVNKGNACSNGTGICLRTGTFVCNAGGTGTQCSAAAAPASAVNELCNGLDDNCDGQIDERNPTGNPMCGGTPCIGVRDAMVQVGSIWMYQYEASRPDAETTDVNNARACSKPNVFPWTSVNRAAAAAACAAVTNSAGNPMRLCTEAEWQAGCESNSTGTGTRWGYNTAEATYDQGVCNDRSLYADPEDPLDPAQAWLTNVLNDGGGETNQCRTTTNATTALYHMSGNVAEWTSTSTVQLGITYYRVRGGSFLTYGPTTACDESFVLNQGTFQNHDLGFRCCSAAAP